MIESKRTREAVLDRGIGCLVGLAIGDALGATLEFKTRDQHPPVTDLVGGGTFNLKPGEWTDDTSMALCLADSIIESNGLDAKDLMERFIRWRDDGENSPTESLGWTDQRVRTCGMTATDRPSRRRSKTMTGLWNPAGCRWWQAAYAVLPGCPGLPGALHFGRVLYNALAGPMAGRHA